MKFLRLQLPPLGGGLRAEAVDLSLPYPRCAYCRRTVDVLEAHAEGQALVLVARCHFDSESVKVPRHFLGAGARVEIGSAFAAHAVEDFWRRRAERNRAWRRQ